MTFSLLAFPGPLARGALDTTPSGPVHRLQGWLNLHGLDPGPVDGVFGPRTERAFADWQTTLEPSDVLVPAQWKELTAPLARAMAQVRKNKFIPSAPHPVLGATSEVAAVPLGEAVAEVARQWLAQSVGGGPLRELPGNSGPVVEACTRWLAKRDRLPCFCGLGAAVHFATGLMCPTDGGYAPDWRLAWCAGWVSTVLRQACESLGVDMPLQGSLSCDELARQAGPVRAGGMLWTPADKGLEEWTTRYVTGLVRPGDLFLVRGAKPGDWTHCGVVLEVLPPIPLMTLEGRKFEGGGLRTAEGNTNKNGEREGKELRERIRGFEGLDFICWRDA